MDKQLESTKWLCTAIDPKSSNERLTHLWGNVASDGLRMHIDYSMPALPKESIPFDYSYIVNPCHDYYDSIELDVQSLINAIKAVKILVNSNDTLLVKIHFSVNTRVLTIYHQDSVGFYDFEIRMLKVQNNHIENDFTFGINAKYLLDAIAGLTCNNTVRTAFSTKGPENHPMFFTCGDNSDRQAIVMPMHLSK